MTIYVNNGSKDGKKNYLVVGGKRVYTGQEFEASDKDIKALKEGYNIDPKVAPKPKTVEKPKTVTKTSEAKQSKKPETKKSENDFFRKSSSYSGFDYKSTKPDKGVK